MAEDRKFEIRNSKLETNPNDQLRIKHKAHETHPFNHACKNDYDVVVVGAGPAGSSAARAAAEQGARVLLIERKKRIGTPVQCAELVSQWVSRYTDFPSRCVVQTIDRMVTHLPDGTTFEMKGPGYMLDRRVFDKELAVSAVLSGATISMETKAVGLSNEGLWVERGSRKEAIQSSVIIGSDGVHSSVSRWLGLLPAKTVVTLQVEIVNARPQPHVHVFFDKDVEGGYAWFFPKGRTANAGLGVVPSKASFLSDLLDRFLNRLVDAGLLSEIKIVEKSGGSIPCEKPRQTVFGNVLLAGDAAGHAHPITGGGILNAIIAGRIAGKIAAQAVQREDIGYLETYEREWREAFGDALDYGARKRAFLEENWSDKEMDFENLIPRTWVGFKEYYADRRRG
jgi:digeranylgeranylglycerophospholipid reductase